MSEMIKMLSHRSYCHCSMKRPGQDPADVYTEVPEAAHSLHQGPTDHESCICSLLLPSEVHN